MGDFQDLLELCEPEPKWGGGLSTWHVKAQHQQEAARISAQLDRGVPAAAAVLESTGTTAQWKRPGSFEMVDVNPIPAWTTIFSGMPMTSPEVIFACANRALGALDQAVEEAEEREQSVAGRIESVVGKPRALLRALRGASAESRKHPSAFWTGLITATIGGLIVAYIAYRNGWV